MVVRKTQLGWEAAWWREWVVGWGLTTNASISIHGEWWAHRVKCLGISKARHQVHRFSQAPLAPTRWVCIPQPLVRGIGCASHDATGVYLQIQNVNIIEYIIIGQRIIPICFIVLQAIRLELGSLGICAVADVQTLTHDTRCMFMSFSMFTWIFIRVCDNKKTIYQSRQLNMTHFMYGEFGTISLALRWSRSNYVAV